MWFLDNIVEWLDSVAGFFYDAYQEVRGWVWPFYYLQYPLYALYEAFWYITYYFGQFNEWLDWAAGRLAAIFSLEQITAYFRTWIDAAINAWNWVVNAFQNVWNIVDDWWSSAKYAVLAWIDDAKLWFQALLDEANAWLARLQSYWDSIAGKIPTWDEVVTWWKSWPGQVWSVITSWWGGALLDVMGLIGTAFTERDSWWAGWEDFRDKVAEFFTDPLEFLLNRFFDWFLGPEE